MTSSAEWWGLLPVLAWAGSVSALRVRGEAAMDCIARGTVLWAAAVWIAANLLSGFEALAPFGVRVFWVIFAVGIWTAVWRGGNLARLRVAPVFARWEWAPLALCLIPIVLAGVVAAVAPAATWDVLNYHQPRQWMWLQQGGLGHYPTLNDRMLMMPPLAETIGAHFLALTGDDRWANVPQWASYVLSAALAFGAVRRLGGGRPAAWLGAWLCLTLPMAYHEASNAKNDLMGAFWTLVVLNEVLRARTGGAVGVMSGVWAGGAAGLAVLTKSTAFLFLPPLLVAGVWGWGRAAGVRMAVRASVWATIVAVTLTGPFFARNLAWYGTPLGVHRAEEGGEQANTVHRPWVLFSNCLRLATQHLSGPSDSWNQKQEKTVRDLHAWAGIKIEDGRTTLWDLPYRVYYRPSDEICAGAGIHLILILGALITVGCWGAARRHGWLAISVAVGALFYIWILKWQPWAPRLQLPGFMIGCVLVAALIALRPRPVWLIVGWAMGVAAWWPSRETSVRPLWSAPSLLSMNREENRYRMAPEMQGQDARIAFVLRDHGVKQLSLLSIHHMVYPLMRQLGEQVPELKINEVGVAQPEAVLVRDYGRAQTMWRELAAKENYRLVLHEASDWLYLRSDVVARAKAASVIKE